MSLLAVVPGRQLGIQLPRVLLMCFEAAFFTEFWLRFAVCPSVILFGIEYNNYIDFFACLPFIPKLYYVTDVCMPLDNNQQTNRYNTMCVNTYVSYISPQTSVALGVQAVLSESTRRMLHDVIILVPVFSIFSICFPRKGTLTMRPGMGSGVGWDHLGI